MKRPTTGWRVSIGPDFINYVIKAAALIAVVAWLVMYAENKRGNKFSPSREFFNEFNDRYGDLAKQIKLPFTILTVVLVICAVIVWIVA